MVHLKSFRSAYSKPTCFNSSAISCSMNIDSCVRFGHLMNVIREVHADTLSKLSIPPIVLAAIGRMVTSLKDISKSP